MAKLQSPSSRYDRHSWHVMPPPPPPPRRRACTAALSALALALVAASLFLFLDLTDTGRSARATLLAGASAAGRLTPRFARPAAAAASSFGGLCGPIPSVEQSLADVDIYRENLDRDLARWQSRRFGLEDVREARRRLAAAGDRGDLYFLAETRNGSFYLHDFPDGKCPEGACNPVLLTLVDTLTRAAAAGRVALPDTTFVLTVGDEGVCPEGDPDRCPAPVLSGNRRVGLVDVLVPLFHIPFERHELPWEAKKRLAFFRGTPFCNTDAHRIAGRHVNCSRLVLSELAAAHPDLLNVSITERFTWRGRSWAPLEGPFTSRADHAQYQMLINLDGYAASWRFSWLLAANSLVLKQESAFLQYFYGSAKPCVHYLPFWREREEDILDVVSAALRDQAAAQAVAANAQAFAAKYLHEEAKFRYWEETLRRYDALMRRPAAPTPAEGAGAAEAAGPEPAAAGA